jgi:hypothetical protein
LLAVPQVNRRGHLLQAKPHGRLYRSRSAAITVVPCR